MPHFITYFIYLFFTVTESIQNDGRSSEYYKIFMGMFITRNMIQNGHRRGVYMNMEITEMETAEDTGTHRIICVSFK